MNSKIKIVFKYVTFSLFFLTCSLSEAKLEHLTGVRLEVLSIKIDTRLLSEPDLNKLGRLTFPSPAETYKFNDARRSWVENQSLANKLSLSIRSNQLNAADFSEAAIRLEGLASDANRIKQSIETTIDVAAKSFMTTNSQRLSTPMDIDLRRQFYTFVLYEKNLTTTSPLSVGKPTKFSLARENFFIDLYMEPEAIQILNEFTITYQSGLDLGITLSSRYPVNFKHFLVATCKAVDVTDTFLSIEIPGTTENHLVCALQANQGSLRFKVIKQEL